MVIIMRIFIMMVLVMMMKIVITITFLSWLLFTNVNLFKQYDNYNDNKDDNGNNEYLSVLGIFNESRYWDVTAEYAKNSPDDLLINITVTNHGPDKTKLHVLPTLWYRNTWIWGCKHEGCTKKARIKEIDKNAVECWHETLGKFVFMADVGQDGKPVEMLYTENETNSEVGS